jgi:archaeosine synthase beta-subunit
MLVREPRHEVDPSRPYAFFQEAERSREGIIESVATVFLTNRECPFSCVMCDLWKHTLRDVISAGMIPRQIEHALANLQPCDSIKLYNSGNFFDPQAIPFADHDRIASIVRGFRTVVVENHPKLCRDICSEFAERISPARLEVAIGLETSHQPTLRWLNKGMELADFEKAVHKLLDAKISTRVFVMLGFPGMSREESVERALQTIEYAASLGVDCFSVIPTRSTMPAFEREEKMGRFLAPTGRMLELVADQGIALNKGRVFVDLWDAESLFRDDTRGLERIARLHEMNLTQQVLPAI